MHLTYFVHVCAWQDAAVEAPAPLDESCDLGKKSHWDAEFARDLAVFRETGDPGYAWFEEQLGSRLLAFFDESPLIDNEWRGGRVLDVGCGNGQLLMDLHELGYTALYGLDYAEPAIQLCQEFLVARGEDGSDPVPFADLTVGDISALPYGDDTFVIVHDKGTYDAWRLGDKPHDAYASQVHRVMVPGGLFVLSCVNWTVEELTALFAGGDSAGFIVKTSLKGAAFNYGGVTGHNVCTVVFQKCS